MLAEIFDSVAGRPSTAAQRMLMDVADPLNLPLIMY
jgi:hypothetical protein